MTQTDDASFESTSGFAAVPAIVLNATATTNAAASVRFHLMFFMVVSPSNLSRYRVPAVGTVCSAPGATDMCHWIHFQPSGYFTAMAVPNNLSIRSSTPAFFR